MNLKYVLGRKLLYQTCCCSRCGGFLCYHAMIYDEQHRLQERCFIHRTPSFLSTHYGVRLFSISLKRLNIFTRLTSYFNQKKTNDTESEKDVTTVNVSKSESFPDSTQCVNNSLPKNSKWMSLLHRIPLSSPYIITTPVTTTLESSSEDSQMKKQHFCQEMFESTETFLQQYNKDLDLILKKATPQTSASKSKQKLSKLNAKSKFDNKTDVLKNIKYPVIKVSKGVAQKTQHFQETRQFLESMNIPCNELENYPNVQEMSQETILTCISALKSKGINVVFSLFLIDRVYSEMKYQLQNRKCDPKKKQSNGLDLTSFRQVRAYLELCQLLDTPDLDIRKLLEQLADVGQYPDIFVLHKKVKMLRSIGATSKDILLHLEILQGYEIFDQKIVLYKKSPHVGQDPFPVQLFLAKTMTSFREQLALGSDVNEICKLLGVSVADFQACWGFKYQNINKLQYKVQMCLAAGISKKDIFNNLGVLVGLPVDQCHAVTNSFRVSGLPASVFVLCDVISAVNHNGNDNNNIRNQNKSIDTCSHRTVEEDWMGEAKTLFPDETPPILPPKRKQPHNFRKHELSTKKHRRSIFNLIEHLVNLDGAMVSAMYECHINVSSVDVLDIPKNLDYLMSLNFTKRDIAMCPLILANSHNSLVRVVQESENLILMQLQSLLPAQSAPLCLFESLPVTLASSYSHAIDKDQLSCLVFASPLRQLNIYQYFLEREQLQLGLS